MIEMDKSAIMEILNPHQKLEYFGIFAEEIEMFTPGLVARSQKG
jgi:hypothetical protein